MNEPRKIPNWLIAIIRPLHNKAIVAIGVSFLAAIMGWLWQLSLPYWLLLIIAVGIGVVFFLWLAAWVSDWFYRNTGKLQINKTAHAETTKWGRKYRIELTNVGYDPLPGVAVVVASSEALGDGAEQRQLKANALINRTLTIAYTDDGNKLPWPTRFMIGAKGNKQLIDVVHIWNRGETYLLITDAHAKNNGGAARSSEAQLPAGDYWVRLEARNESGVLIAFTVHFGMGNNTPFFRVIP